AFRHKITTSSPPTNIPRDISVTRLISLWTPLAHLENYAPPISMLVMTTAHSNALACLYTPPRRAMFLAYVYRSAEEEIPFTLTIQMATQQFICTWINSTMH